MDRKLLIGEFAKLNNISTQTLRFYEKKGVLIPKIVDPSNNYRYYTIDQFEELDKIRFLRYMGLSLEDILNHKKIDTVEGGIEALKKQHANIIDKIKKLNKIDKKFQSLFNDIERYKTQYNNKAIMIQKVDNIQGLIGYVKTGEWEEIELKLREFRDVLDCRDMFGQFHGLSVILDKEDILSGNTTRFKGVVISVDEEEKQVIKNKISQLDMGYCIVKYHVGPYDTIKNSYKEILEYVKENNIELIGDSIESTVIDSFIVSNENEYLTEIKIPVNIKSGTNQ